MLFLIIKLKKTIVDAPQKRYTKLEGPFSYWLSKGNTAVKNNIEKRLVLLEAPNNSQAYEALKSLLKISDKCNCFYPYMSRFIEMIDSNNSYVRTRGLTLVAYNAKWDVEDKIDKIIDTYLVHITDERPICARQCTKLSPLIAKAKRPYTRNHFRIKKR